MTSCLVWCKATTWWNFDGFRDGKFFFPWRWGGSDPSVDAYLRWHITYSPHDISLESDGGVIMTGENRRTQRKSCPSATLSTTNPTWIDPGANPGLRDERPATNDLSHGHCPGMVCNTVSSDFLSLCPLSKSAFLKLLYAYHQWYDSEF
jgi:hypothetical protein